MNWGVTHICTVAGRALQTCILVADSSIGLIPLKLLSESIDCVRTRGKKVRIWWGIGLSRMFHHFPWLAGELRLPVTELTDSHLADWRSLLCVFFESSHLSRSDIDFDVAKSAIVGIKSTWFGYGESHCCWLDKAKRKALHGTTMKFSDANFKHKMISLWNSMEMFRTVWKESLALHSGGYMWRAAGEPQMKGRAELQNLLTRRRYQEILEVWVQ